MQRHAAVFRRQDLL
jgi:succinate dehydrogenase (ubiquinone) flavoprotein subunit